MQSWANDQLRILDKINPSDLERCVAGINAFEFKCDPGEFARLVVLLPDGQYVYLKYSQLADQVAQVPIGFATSGDMDHLDSYTKYESIQSIVLVIPITNGSGLNLTLENGKPKEPFTIIACLDRAISSQGRASHYEYQPSNLVSTFAQPGRLLLVSSIEQA